LIQNILSFSGCKIFLFFRTTDGSSGIINVVLNKFQICLSGWRHKIEDALRIEEIQKERDHWEDQDVGGWTIFKVILER
jgi:hypothetical protein